MRISLINDMQNVILLETNAKFATGNVGIVFGIVVDMCLQKFVNRICALEKQRQCVAKMHRISARAEEESESEKSKNRIYTFR